ncbi:MAG: hypothetical protein R3E32_29175 [Chitinophagales bacterium]
MESKKIIGGVLIAVGAIMMLIGSMGLLGGGGQFLGESMGAFGALVPLILGVIFFTSGIGLYKTIGGGNSGGGTA